MRPWDDASLGLCVPRTLRPLPKWMDGWSASKNGDILSQNDQGQNEPRAHHPRDGMDHPRDASSHFFLGRIVQGRNVTDFLHNFHFEIPKYIWKKL
jgi:hypothetical protein